jgi:hypothetical protein
MWDDPYLLRVDLCLDWYQVYSTGVYSMGLLAIRFPDLSKENSGQVRFTRPLVIIPGPNQPKNLQPYMQSLLLALSDPFDETKHIPITLKSGEKIKVKLILTGILADTPARNKMTLWNGPNSYLPCGWCKFEGTPQARVSGKKGQTIYYFGYKEPVELPNVGSELLWGKKKKRKNLCKVGDKLLRISDSTQAHRGKEVDADPKKNTPRSNGCKGSSFVINQIPYASYNNLWVVPVAHCILYGVVSDFCKYLFCDSPDSKDPYVVQPAERKLISARENHVRLPTDAGRPYRDIVKNVNNFKIEEWLHFVETFSAYIFLEMLNPVVHDMWLHLVKAVGHYLRPSAYNTTLEFERASREASLSLTTFSSLLEERNFPKNIFTSNLHMACCRLREQEIARGAAHRETELVVERCIQEAKTTVGRKQVREPEKAYVNACLWERRLNTVNSFVESKTGIVPESISVKEKGCSLLGASRALADVSLTEQELLDSLNSFINYYKHSPWKRATFQRAIETGSFRLYERAECVCDSFTAVGRNSPRKRSNCWGMLQYGRIKEVYIMLIKYFVEFVDDGGECVPIRLAIGPLYESPCPQQDGLLIADGEPKFPHYAVDIDTFTAKLVAFYPNGSEKLKKYFMPCQHKPKRLTPIS